MTQVQILNEAILFHFVLMPLGKAWIRLLSPQLRVDSKPDWVLVEKMSSLEKDFRLRICTTFIDILLQLLGNQFRRKTEFKPALVHLKTDLVPHPTHSVEVR